MVAERNALLHISPAQNALLSVGGPSLVYSDDELSEDDVAELVNIASRLSGIDKLRVRRSGDRWYFDVKADSLGNWSKPEATNEMKRYIDTFIMKRKNP